MKKQPGTITRKQLASLKLMVSRLLVEHIAKLIENDDMDLVEIPVCEKALKLAKVDQITDLNQAIAADELITKIIYTEVVLESQRLIAGIKKLKRKKRKGKANA